MGMDLPKLMDNCIKACFLGKWHSLEATCFFLSFNPRYPATRRRRTARYKTHSNRAPTGHELAHQRSQFMTSPVYMRTWSPWNSVMIKCMRKQCVPGALSPLLPPRLGTRLSVSVREPICRFITVLHTSI